MSLYLTHISTVLSLKKFVHVKQCWKVYSSIIIYSKASHYSHYIKCEHVHIFDDWPRTDFVRSEFALSFSDYDVLLRIYCSLKSLILSESYIRAKQIGSFVIKLIRNCKRNPDKKHNSIILLVLQNLPAHPNEHCLHVPSLLLHGSSLMQCPSHWCTQFSPNVWLLQTDDVKKYFLSII